MTPAETATETPAEPTAKPNAESPTESATETEDEPVFNFPRLSTVPCSACTFSPERQRCCSYDSHVKIFYEAGDRATWALGSDWILKDLGPRHANAEALNACFVKENTTIPVPTIIADHKDSGHTLTLMTRIPGEPLNVAWPKLTDSEKEKIAEQTAEYLLQLRALQSDCIKGVGDHPTYSHWLYEEDGQANAPCPFFTSDEETWNGLARRLNPAVPEKARRRLRSYMPPVEPFTFTHNDLTHVNIMVKDGELTGIIDWEGAGYYPVWWQYTSNIITLEGEDDAQWKRLLRKYMPKIDGAYWFWVYYYFLCRKDLESGPAKKFLDQCDESEDSEGEATERED
ncbi:kinase-like protein [Aspergillus saccharolyticus JOP 1030-1]|uniref:Kinase-like protein n=1 Tax=Aspergillus saccharolyticus JOP 1030-1 TaxID=1450539 RepID=A0A318ZCN6_9EURO|nr:kinase-like protein [Aspergillus saccharolyticus JOP 1030-1]PYH44074.1 kinase-like protein [Aspergillus saccharolyticus JOP 1030-1]